MSETQKHQHLHLRCWILVAPCCSQWTTLLVTLLCQLSVLRSVRGRTPPPLETWFPGSSGIFRNIFLFSIFLFHPKIFFTQNFLMSCGWSKVWHNATKHSIFLLTVCCEQNRTLQGTQEMHNNLMDKTCGWCIHFTGFMFVFCCQFRSPNCWTGFFGTSEKLWVLEISTLDKRPEFFVPPVEILRIAGPKQEPCMILVVRVPSHSVIPLVFLPNCPLPLFLFRNCLQGYFPLHTFLCAAAPSTKKCCCTIVCCPVREIQGGNWKAGTE